MLTLPPKSDIINSLVQPSVVISDLSGCGAVGSAPRLGRGGRPFKSDHPDHRNYLGDEGGKIRNKVHMPKNLSKLKHSGFLGWFKSHKAFSITLGSVLAIFLVVVGFTMIYYRDKAAPGTTIADTKVGGQNLTQLKETVGNIVSNMKLSLTYNGKSATATAKDFGVNIDVNKVAQEALKTGQRNPFSTLFLAKHFDLTGSYNKETVADFVHTNFPELTTEPKDAQVIYDKNTNQYVVQPGAIGQSVQTDKLYAEVQKLLSSPRIASYEITTNDSKPTVSNEAAQVVATSNNKVLSLPIKIINSGKTLWTLDPWDIADWTTMTLNQQTGTYDVAYDKAKIKNFVSSSVVGQISNKPINQKAITDANGQVLQIVSQGINGQEPENIDTVVNSIYEMLNSDQGGTIELKTKDAPFKTDATVAKDGHWIEANLSTFTVTLHDGTNAVWSTDQTSQGKPGNGTITGLYTVWRKTQEQCMPNPPSTQPLCGIHWVTYWERSGYAFHEAWWLDYNKGNVRSYISHGCINMFTADAKRVYDWSSIGTPVWVHR